MADEAAVSLKLPDFWETQATLWFARAEAQFQLRNITADETRFNYVVSALSAATAVQVYSCLENPPMTDKYGTLKTLLLAVFGLSKEQRAQRLLGLSDVGETRPSERLNHMMALRGGFSSDILFQEIFLRHLPEQIRLPLTSSGVTNLRDMAEMADKLCWARCRIGAAVWNQEPSDVAPAPSPDEPTPVAASTRRHNPTPPPQPSPERTWCYYHARFGQKARSCRPPCTFGKSGNGRAGVHPWP